MGQDILLIGGSLNQTTMMHKIAENLKDFNCHFTPFYADGILKILSQKSLLDFTILGGRHLQNTLAYLQHHQLPIDFSGQAHSYDAVITCTDLVIQKNIKGKRLVLVQEGMTEPEGFLYKLVKKFRLPRYLANTAATGLSNAYDIFCVASQGYRDLFVNKGIRPEKIAVTGIPNFDHAEAYRQNDFPYRDFVLVATSCARETFKPDDRFAFLKKAVNIAQGRQLIFKLHPNENFERATREIHQVIPRAQIFTDGNVNHMIANCSALITQYSSVVFVGLALGKEVHSYFDLGQLKKLTPLQNGGTSASHIAELCRQLVHTSDAELAAIRARYSQKLTWKLANVS
jgi:hypothetical protein